MLTLLINNEIAHECRKYPNYYITETGNLYSIFIKSGHGAIDISKPHLLKYGQDENGYYRVVLCVNGVKKYRKVHTVVAEQFIGDIIPPMVVNHKDGNIHNNNVWNLEIVTPQYNTIHAHKIGLCKRDIPVNVTLRDMNFQFANMEECANFFTGINLSYLNQIRNNEILFSNVLFKRQTDDYKSKIDCYYNGNYYMTFDSMQDASYYFNKSRGSVSSAINNKSEYRNRVNQFQISFPSVSTIES